MTSCVTSRPSCSRRHAVARLAPAAGAVRRPPALLAAVAVAAALIAVALLPRASDPSDPVAPAQQARSCTVFPDASLLLRDAPCTSNPFGQ